MKKIKPTITSLYPKKSVMTRKRANNQLSKQHRPRELSAIMEKASSICTFPYGNHQPHGDTWAFKMRDSATEELIFNFNLINLNLNLGSHLSLVAIILDNVVNVAWIFVNTWSPKHDKQELITHVEMERQQCFRTEHKWFMTPWHVHFPLPF